MEWNRTFTEWLRFVEGKPEAIIQDMESLSNENDELIRVIKLGRKYGTHLELATSDEKALLRKYGYQVDMPPFPMFIQIPPDIEGFQEGMKKLTNYYNNKN